MPDNKKLLYDQAVKDGKYSKSYEDFTEQFSTRDNQAKLWEQARNDGMYSKSFEDFQSQFFNETETQVAPPTGYVWGGDDKDTKEISAGSYGTTVEKTDLDNKGVSKLVEQTKQDQALKAVREGRKGDYSTTADVRAREGMSEYDLSRNERRSPMEKMMWKAFGEAEGETTMAQHESDLNAISTDIGQLTLSVKSLDRQIKDKYGPNVYTDYDTKVASLKKEYERLNAIPEAERQNHVDEYRAYSELSKEVEDFQKDELLIERDQMAQLMEDNYTKARSLLDQDGYETINRMMNTEQSIQAYEDKQSNELGGIDKVDYFADGIILKSVAKLPAALGAMMNITENLTTGDEKYTVWDKIEDYLGDLQSDAKKVFPTPSKWSRQLVTKTAKWDRGDKVFDVDYDKDGEVEAIRDSKGNKLDIMLNAEQQKELKTLDAKEQWNWSGFPYQTSEVAMDLLWQVAGTKGIGGGLAKIGAGQKLSYGVGTTLTTMGMMADPLYQEGLKMFDGDRRKAAEYAGLSGLLIGFSSNLFGLESRLAGGPGGLMDKVMKGSASKSGSIASAAKTKALTILKEGVGEALEETVIEKGIQAGVQYMLGHQPEMPDAKEMKSEAVISFAVGALFGGALSNDSNPVKDSALLAASKDPDAVEKTLRSQIELGNIKVPNAKGDKPTTEEIDKFVGDKKNELVKVAAQVEALEEVTGKEGSPEIAAKFQERNELEAKRDKAEAAGLKVIKEHHDQRIEEIDTEIAKEVNQVPVEEETATEKPAAQEVAAEELVTEVSDIKEIPTEDAPVAKDASPLNDLVGSVVTTPDVQGELKADDKGFFVMDGDKRVEVSGENVDIEKVEPKKGKRKTKLSEKTKSLNASSSRDDIGVFFAEGGRIKESDLNINGDPNFIKDNPSIRKNYTSPDGENMDVVAQRIADKYGMDEQAVIQEMVDFIASADSAGDVVREMQARESTDLPVNSEYIITPKEAKVDKPSVVPKEISEGMSKRDTTELEGWVNQFTAEDGELNTEDLVQTIGDREFAKDFLGMSDQVYDAVQKMAGKVTTSKKSDSRPDVEQEISTADHSDNGFISNSIMGLKIGGKSLGADIMPMLRKFYKLTFTAKGLLNSSLNRLNTGRVSRINSNMKRVSRLSRKLNRQVKEHFGNAAPAAMRGIKILLENGSVIDAMLIDGKPVEIDQAGPVTQEIMETIQEMRAHVDALSAELVALGVVDGDLAIDILENQGTYLTRSYKIHDDPDWVNKVRDTAVWNRAKDLIRRQSERSIVELNKARARYVEHMTAKGKPASTKVFWMDKIKAIDKAIDIAQKKVANQNGELDGEVEAIVRKQTNVSTSNVAKKGKLGSKDLGILGKRDLAPELVDLFGEYEDPLMVYSKSIYKQIHLLENFIFLRQVEDAGLKEGWLKTQADKTHYVKVAADMSKTMSPLNGYYTTPELNEAFETYNENWTADFIGKALFPLMKLSSTAKYMKTILSPVTQVRNFVFNVFFMYSNGLGYNPLSKQGKDAWKIAASEVDLYDSKFSKGEQDAMMEELIEMGVVGESVTFQEMRQLIKDSQQATPGFIQAGFDAVSGLIPEARKFAEQMYAFGDDYWRILMYFKERDRLSKLRLGKEYKDLRPDEQQQMKLIASERVTEQMPTYSRIPQNIGKLRALPFSATFVSFPYETMRVMTNMIKNVYVDAMTPDAGYKVAGVSYNRIVAAQRIAGLSSLVAATAGISALARSMQGLDKEDEDDLRYFIPEWSENSFLAVINKDGPYFNYIDLNFVVPQAFVLSAFNALGDRRKNWYERLGAAGYQLTSSFTDMDMTTKRIIEAYQNRMESGREIAAKNDPDNNKKRLAHVTKGLEPGVLSTGKRIYKSFDSPELDYYGKLDPRIELGTLITGVRVSPGNIEGSFQFRARDFANMMRGAKALYSAEQRKQKYKGKHNSPDLDPYYESATKAYKKTMLDAHKVYMAALKLGASSEVVNDHLKSAGFNAGQIREIKSGVIKAPKFKGKR